MNFPPNLDGSAAAFRFQGTVKTLDLGKLKSGNNEQRVLRQIMRIFLPSLTQSSYHTFNYALLPSLNGPPQIVPLTPANTFLALQLPQ